MFKIRKMVAMVVALATVSAFAVGANAEEFTLDSAAIATADEVVSAEPASESSVDVEPVLADVASAEAIDIDLAEGEQYVTFPSDNPLLRDSGQDFDIPVGTASRSSNILSLNGKTTVTLKLASCSATPAMKFFVALNVRGALGFYKMTDEVSFSSSAIGSTATWKVASGSTDFKVVVTKASGSSGNLSGRFTYTTQ